MLYLYVLALALRSCNALIQSTHLDLIHRSTVRQGAETVANERETLASLSNESVSIGIPPRTLIERLDLSLRAADRLAIVGKNGAGKSTMAQLLALKVITDKLHEGSDGSVEQLYDMNTFKLSSGSNEIKNVDAFTPVFISFESHTKLLQDELDAFEYSRYSILHKRATPASFLFPELYPAELEMSVIGYRPRRTRLSPLPVPYDAENDHPALASLEEAACQEETKKLLVRFGLFDIRHRPIYGLSTGEARKLMIVAFLLSGSRFLILDEAFEGLDVNSRTELKKAISSSSVLSNDQTVVNICHREDDLDIVVPTHALHIGEGKSGVGWSCGSWKDMEASVRAFLRQQTDLSDTTQRISPTFSAITSNIEDRAKIVEFNEVTIAYQSTVVLKKLSMTIREGENWGIKGSNGSGKSTILNLITGENPKAFQQNIWLFGKKKGSGESIWDIKRQLGLLSTSLHMAYNKYATPASREIGGIGGFAKITSFEVVCSGFFDSIGLYDKITLEQEKTARMWVSRFGLDDIIVPHASRDAANGVPRTSHNFIDLSHGQQKLVLLCRAMVKSPRLLLLDEPSHGLSGLNRVRFLEILRILAVDESVAIVYVTHRQDEVDALGFENVLQL